MRVAVFRTTNEVGYAMAPVLLTYSRSPCRLLQRVPELVETTHIKIGQVIHSAIIVIVRKPSVELGRLGVPFVPAGRNAHIVRKRRKIDERPRADDRHCRD